LVFIIKKKKNNISSPRSRKSKVVDAFFKFTELRRIQCVLRLCYDIIYYKEIANAKRKTKSEEINYQVQKKFNEFVKTAKK